MRIGTIMFAAAMATASAPVLAGEAEMTALAAEKAAVLSNMHKKAKRALVNAAQDEAFPRYFTSHDHGAKSDAKSRIEQVTLTVQSRFHVEEMCLISKDGPELTRIVGREIAPDSDLSPDESGAGFFAPGLATKPRRAYVSNPYMSPDANRWVLAYVTPVVVEGDKEAILHYEHGLDAYQAVLNKGMSGVYRYVIAVSDGGYVVSDSRTPIDIERKGDMEADADYFQPVEKAAGKGVAGVYAGVGDRKRGSATVSENGTDYAVAFATVEGGWVVMAIERQ